MVIVASLLPVVEAWPDPESAGPPTISVGSRVRFEAPTLASNRIEGTVVELDEKVLVVRRHHLDLLPVPREGIARLDVCTGQRRFKLRGALVGAGIGLVAMGLLCGGDSGGCGQAFPVVTFSALAGTGIGALVKGDRWQTVPRARVRVALAPAPQGAGLAVSVGF
jgi:hypothetical protein